MAISFRDGASPGQNAEHVHLPGNVSRAGGRPAPYFFCCLFLPTNGRRGRSETIAAGVAISNILEPYCRAIFQKEVEDSQKNSEELLDEFASENAQKFRKGDDPA
jgi:hypothetical protein